MNTGASASDWGAGYVTDIPYLPGYYRNQCPQHLNIACLLGGVAGIQVSPGEPLRYVELGCGQGLGALMLAGCNPQWEVVGIDFNPAQIAAARELAAAGNIANVRFIEADLASFAGTGSAQEVPQADIVSAHGVWSWVGDAARAGIVRLIADKLRPGGIACLSYNALPAWQGALGLQRLLLEAGRQNPGTSSRQVAAGWETVRMLAAAGATHLRNSDLVRSLLQHGERAHVAYLAHEYMNAAWRPCFHGDVVRALGAAKLDWVASAQLVENFTPLMLDDEARAITARFDDPMIVELIKDMFLPRGLRQDVFVRGARRLSAAERDAALGAVSLALQVEPAQFAWEFDVPAGKATFNREFFEPIVTELAVAPRSVKELLTLPGLRRRDNPGEVVGMLVGSHQALPVLQAPGEPDARVRRLNAAIADRFVRPDRLDMGLALATSGSGSPLPCTTLDLFVVDRLQSGEPTDAAAWAAELGAGSPLDEQDRLRDFIERLLRERAPVWRRLGALPRVAADA